MGGGARKGRGAGLNPDGRFEPTRREPVDDGWGETEDDEAFAPAALATTVAEDRARRVITENDSPDVGFTRSINPYRGCEHGCVYCYARPSHSYLGLSPGLDFESRLFAKPDAARLLAQELRRPGYRVEPIALGTNTDPYQPVERRLEITRGILETLAAHRHPVAIVTKSATILRDLDILAPMAREGLAAAMVSVTTLERGLARRLEPRAAAPARRLETIAGLAAAGVPVGVMAAPMIPGLNDGELESILAACFEAGARSAGYTLVRLPHEIKDLFADWLETHAPLRAERVMGLIRETRGGRLNDSTFGRRMRGTGAYAELLARRFRLARRRLGYGPAPELDCDKFRVPPRAGDQLSLL